ncbi:hypothetical protein H1R20_g3062, partial [Candolleomyces eurysporus]
MPHYADSHYLSGSSSLKPPSRQSISGRRSSASLRGSSPQANGELDGAGANGRHHSLAHELAVALMPEPSAGSKLLAEEFGIEFDEGAEGIDDQGVVGESDEREERHLISDETELNAQLLASSSDTRPSFADELNGHDSFAEDEAAPGANLTSDESFGGGDLDPTFDSPSVSPTRPRQRTPEKDAMDVLSENLEFTEKFITHLRTLDAAESGKSSSSSQQPKLERLASDVIRRMNESVRERETQVRDLLEYEREFRKIGGEVGGSDVLGQLDELEGVDELTETDQPTSSSSNANNNTSSTANSRSLHTLVEEEPTTPTAPRRLSSHFSSQHDWELDPDKNHLGDAYEVSPATSPMRAAFSLPPPPPLTGAPTPAKLIPQLTHIRSFTSSTVSSLTSISEHAQVNGVATADAGRKIRSLKNKLGNWKTEWESAERSRARIERWEAGLADVEGLDTPTTPATPTRLSGRRVDGRKLVQEQLKAFELALADAALKTQAIMAR